MNAFLNTLLDRTRAITAAVPNSIVTATTAIGAIGLFTVSVEAFGDARIAHGFTSAELLESEAPIVAPPPADKAEEEKREPEALPESTDGAYAATPSKSEDNEAELLFASLDAALEAYEGGDAPLPETIDVLSQEGPGGVLPTRGPEGQAVFTAYARPFKASDDQPRLAVLMTGLGLSAALTQYAIDTLPAEVTLAFSPYSGDLQRWVDRARADGHEVMLELPMEPFDYPDNDPGPHTLLVDADRAERGRRLDWLMARTSGYIAVTNRFGERFTTQGDALSSVMTVLQDRGVGFVYGGGAQNARVKSLANMMRVPVATADERLDPQQDSAQLDSHFLRLEARALQSGQALAVMDARPAAIAEISQWLKTLGLKGYDHAPVSALMSAGDAQAIVRPRTAPAAAPQFQSVSAGFGRTENEAYDDAKDGAKSEKAEKDGAKK